MGVSSSPRELRGNKLRERAIIRVYTYDRRSLAYLARAALIFLTFVSGCPIDFASSRLLRDLITRKEREKRRIGE